MGPELGNQSPALPQPLLSHHGEHIEHQARSIRVCEVQRTEGPRGLEKDVPSSINVRWSWPARGCSHTLHRPQQGIECHTNGSSPAMTSTQALIISHLDCYCLWSSFYQHVLHTTSKVIQISNLIQKLFHPFALPMSQFLLGIQAHKDLVHFHFFNHSLCHQLLYPLYSLEVKLFLASPSDEPRLE